MKIFARIMKVTLRGTSECPCGKSLNVGDQVFLVGPWPNSEGIKEHWLCSEDSEKLIELNPGDFNVGIEGRQKKSLGELEPSKSQFGRSEDLVDFFNLPLR